MVTPQKDLPDPVEQYNAISLVFNPDAYPYFLNSDAQAKNALTEFV
ncbi:hypothetical protein [Niabella aurantiaca]|nr:hypothetical protein [Niabella aurantiaca]